MIASKLKPHGHNSQLSSPPHAIKTSATAQGGSKKGHSCASLLAFKPLPIEFRSGDFNYRQIAREGNVAIYEQTWTGNSDPTVCYEVIRIRRRNGFEINGRFVEPAEVYPNSDVWGVDGFTFTDKDAAFAKLREVAGT
jgi:hypothetical protein